MRGILWKLLDRLVQQFTILLQNAGADVEEIHAEFDAMLQYACQYISLSILSYQGVWWRLFHAPVSTEWANALTLVELLFPYQCQMEHLRECFLK